MNHTLKAFIIAATALNFSPAFADTSDLVLSDKTQKLISDYIEQNGRSETKGTDQAGCTLDATINEAHEDNKKIFALSNREKAEIGILCSQETGYRTQYFKNLRKDNHI